MKWDLTDMALHSKLCKWELDGLGATKLHTLLEQYFKLMSSQQPFTALFHDTVPGSLSIRLQRDQYI